MDIHTDALLSAIAGCGSSAWLAKMMIARALRDLATLHEKAQKIDVAIGGITVRLDLLKKHDRLIQVHSEKISALEGKYGAINPRSRPHP